MSKNTSIKFNNAINGLTGLQNLNNFPHIDRTMSQFDSTLFSTLDNGMAYRTQFENLILTMCEFDLPEGCNADFLMKCLLYEGQAAFCNDPIMGWINLRATIVGKPDIYDLPKRIRGTSNDFNKEYSKDQFIYLRANPQCVPLIAYVNHFCNIITEIENTLRVNLKAQKTPITFAGTEDQQLSLINTYEKIEGNVPYLFVRQEAQDGIKIEALNTGAPFLADKLQELKKSYKAEFLSFIGLNNVEDKKERMVVDEVNANNQLISSAAQILMSELEPAMKKLTEATGHKCSVKLRTQSEILENDKGKNSEGGSEDVKVYDNSRNDSK